uniref:Retrotransposon gag domain-containing protein n=1 Tax=Brassica oleracea TaxID=3712 RepID=A0A3P6E797_BRAOL|nr:unnamed protein product [Brassica oleracea]
MLCKIFPYSISGDAFRWLSQLQPRSVTSWDDIERAFLYKFLDDAEETREKEKNDKWDRFLASLDEEYMIPIQLLDDVMAKRDEQHGFGEPSKVEEFDTSDPTSASIDNSTPDSIDIGTSETIDTDFCYRSIPLEIPERSSCPHDIADSTHKSTDVSSCSPSPDVEKGITMEDSLELEEFLEVENGEKLDDLDSSREVTMEYFLELEEWLEDMDQNLKKKLDDDQHTSRGDLETSKASIDRNQPDEIDRQPPHIIDLHPPDIDRYRQPTIDRHHPPNIDRCPLLDGPPGCIIEMEPIEERMYLSRASHLDVPKHQRPPIWTEEAVGFHKRVKRIHDPMKTVVSCAVFEAESPIPPDRSIQFSSHIEVLDDHQHVEASQRGLRFRDEVDKGPAEATSVDTDQIPSIDTTTSPSIDTTPSPSIDTTTSSSLDTGRISEQKEFNVRGNLRDGDTITRSDKSGGKKRKNWKKRKMIMGDSQVSLTPHVTPPNRPKHRSTHRHTIKQEHDRRTTHTKGWR